MLTAKLQNVFLCIVLLSGLTACGQTGDLYLPGSEDAQQDTQEVDSQKTTKKQSEN